MSPISFDKEGNSTVLKTSFSAFLVFGGTVELECQAAGEPAPAIEWILADGSKVRAPYISEDGRITVLGTGTLTLRTADTFDTGLYHCIGTSYNDADALTFRITVLDPYVEHNSINGAQLSASVGSTLDLPCTAKGTPPPQIMWIMPDNIFLTAPYYGSRIVVHKNGTLEIRNIRPSDTAEFICVARNDGGESMLVVQLEVVEMLRFPGSYLTTPSNCFTPRGRYSSRIPGPQTPARTSARRRTTSAATSRSRTFTSSEETQHEGSSTKSAAGPSSVTEQG
uniref:Immunoglobulin superfamily member 10 n=1 Tax=Bubo bubo TaxID=30461 RepID=A0A8C0ES28_BUBBB